MKKLSGVEPIWVSIEEAKRMTSFSRTTLYKLIGEGTIDSAKIGKRRVVSTLSIKKLGTKLDDLPKQAAAKDDARPILKEGFYQQAIETAVREILEKEYFPHMREGRNPTSTGKYKMISIPEHRLVAERALGKELPPGAVVHHINQNRGDNRPCNLVVCPDQAYHRLIHGRQNAYNYYGTEP